MSPLVTLLLLLSMRDTGAFVSSPRQHRRVPPVCFEPSPVDPALIGQQLVVMGVSAGAAFYWWTVTVPEKRLEVSKSKKSGEIRDLLDDLSVADEKADGSAVKGDKCLERWLLSDWLDPTKRKEPALPFLPRDKFNSGDNPIIVATALILAFGIANALGERIATVL